MEIVPRFARRHRTPSISQAHVKILGMSSDTFEKEDAG